MKQTLLSLFLALLPLVASADPVEIDSIYYNLVSNAKVAQVTSSPNSYSGALDIPGKVVYNNVTYTVINIASSAFYGCSGLTSITIPTSVTTIGSSAFYGCSGLTSIIIPNAVTTIGSSAFYGCSGLTSIIIPNAVTSINSSTFYGCRGLTSITIGNSVKSIGSSAFYGCSGLTSFNVPSSVTSIAVDAFRGCSNLSSIIVENSNTVYDSRDNCNAIIKKATNELIIGCKSTVIPNTVVSIGSEAFYGCSGLISITIPGSVTSIAVNAFCGCSNLSSIIVDGDNTVYDSRDNCNAIINSATNELVIGCKNTVIPNTVTSIGDSAFYKSSISGEQHIPGNVKSIGDYAFNGCTQLTAVVLEEGVEEVGWHTFSGPIRLLSLPTSLTYMSSMAIDPYVSSSSGIFTPEGDLYVRVYATTPAYINDFAFYYVFGDGHLVVTQGCKDAYKNVKAWSHFGEYLEVGDVNGDGKLNVADVATLIAYVTDQEPKRFIAAAADVNSDGRIDEDDIACLAHSLIDE